MFSSLIGLLILPCALSLLGQDTADHLGIIKRTHEWQRQDENWFDHSVHQLTMDMKGGSFLHYYILITLLFDHRTARLYIIQFLLLKRCAQEWKSGLS